MTATGAYCYLDPYRGGQIAVSEVCRNLSCSVGAEPLALNRLPEFWQPRAAGYLLPTGVVRPGNGPCLPNRSEVPVISGNVSLYNESQGQAIYPTPIVGGLGLLDDVTRHATVSSAFPRGRTWPGGAVRVRTAFRTRDHRPGGERVPGVRCMAWSPAVPPLTWAWKRGCRPSAGRAIGRGNYRCRPTTVPTGGWPLPWPGVASGR